jgi:hypothetical protein
MASTSGPIEKARYIDGATLSHRREPRNHQSQQEPLNPSHASCFPSQAPNVTLTPKFKFAQNVSYVLCTAGLCAALQHISAKSASEPTIRRVAETAAHPGSCRRGVLPRALPPSPRPRPSRQPRSRQFCDFALRRPRCKRARTNQLIEAAAHCNPAVPEDLVYLV